MKVFIALLCLLFLSANIIFAGPGNPNPQTVFQPDNSQITIKVFGDEWYNYTENSEGYTVIKNTEGWWVYAVKTSDGKIIPSKVAAHALDSQTNAEKEFLYNIGKHLQPSEQIIKEKETIKRQFDEQVGKILERTELSRTAKVNGVWHIPVLLVEFSDLPHTYTKQEMESFFNQQGYDNGVGGPGCISDYFKEASYNKLNIVFDVFGWYKDENSYKYYADSYSDSQDRCREMFLRLIDKADADVNFANYDNNADGIVDGVITIHSGPGASQSGDNNYIWNFSWWFSTPPVKDGIKINRFTINEEKEYNRMTGMGNIVHEFGHVLGLPDLYGDGGIGNWCTMASAAWLNSGRTPCHYSVYCKMLLGWTAPVDVSSNCTLTLPDTYNNNSYFNVKAFASDESFLLENIQKNGFNKYVPGNGLLVFHYTPKPTGGSKNIHLEEADGLKDVSLQKNRGDAGDTFPGSTNNNTFGEGTNPSSKLINNSESRVTISNIGNSSSSMSVQVNFNLPASPNFNITSIAIKNDNNGNGRLEPGETADIEITYINNGATVPDAVSQLSALSQTLQYLNIKNPSVPIGAFTGGTTSVVKHSVTVSSSVPVGSVAEFTITLSGGGAAINKNYQAVVSPLFYEGFETASVGNLPAGWEQIIEGDNQAKFTVQGSQSYNFDTQMKFTCTPPNGTKAVYLSENWSDNAYGPTSARLVTPLIDLTTQTGVMLTFKEIRGWDYSWPDTKPVHTIDIVYQTEGSNQWNIITSIPFNSTDFKNWKTQCIDVSACAGKKVKIGFQSTTHSYYWRIDEVMLANRLLTDVKNSDNKTIPESMSLANAYPNPFNPMTNIKFTVSENSNVTIKVFDLLGREVKTLLNENMNTGTYNIQWNAEDNSGKKAASGVYICTLCDGKKTKSIKMILSK